MDLKNVFTKTSIICEPNLGSRNLYPTTSIKDNYKKRNFMLDLITFSNGKDNIFDISQKTNIPLRNLIETYLILKSKKIF